MSTEQKQNTDSMGEPVYDFGRPRLLSTLDVHSETKF